MLSLSIILMFHVFHIKSFISMKMSEFKSLMNLWWLFLFSDRIEDSHWEWVSKVKLCSTSEQQIETEIVKASFWLTCYSADWVSWWSINWSAWRCFALKFNHSSCNWLIFFSSSSFLSKVTFSCFTFFLWLSCIRSQCSLSCKVKSHWLQNSFSILITLLN